MGRGAAARALINYGYHNTSCLSAWTVPAACPLQCPWGGQLPEDSGHCAPRDAKKKRLGWWLEIAGMEKGLLYPGKER